MADQAGNINTEVLLEKLGGCGLFQVVLILLVSFTMVPTVFTYLVMSFGIYNPGWRCAYVNTSSPHDNHTGLELYSMTLPTNTSSTYVNETSLEYITGSCEAYSACPEVEFSPEASTILTEWGLACDSFWVLSTLMSLQMAGNMVGTLFTGYIGDRFGRKIPVHISMGIVASLNVLSYFSVSWEMYGAILFFVGLFGSFKILIQVLVMEYTTEKWRVRIASLPIWTLLSIAFAAFAMVTKDWKILRLVASASGFISVAFLFWVPKSLRFLVARGKTDEAKKVAKRIAKLNVADIAEEESVESLLASYKHKENRSYTIVHLFRRGYRMSTVIIGLLTFTLDLTYFVFNFGISTMPGDMYTNMMIFSVSEIPANILGFTVANLFNRRPSAFVFHISATVLLFVVVALDFTTTGSVKEISILVCVMTSKVCLYVAWMVFYTLCNEVYPTVVRSTVQSYFFLASNVGSVLAPFLIPTDPSTFYISYLVMAVLNTIAAFCVFLLPETKGNPLKDTWDDEEPGEVRKRLKQARRDKDREEDDNL